MVRLHERERPVTEAKLDLTRVLLDWQERHQDLTYGETFRVPGDALGGQIAALAKYLIREERHGDPDRPGGVE